MTEQGKVFREESLEVLGISKGKVEIKPSWTKFPMKVSRNRDSMQDEAEMMEMLAEGAMAGFVLVRENPIANNQYQDERGFYWGIWAIGDAVQGAEAQPADAPPEPQDAPETPETGDRERERPASIPRAFRNQDPTRDSIERQTAAKAATDLTVAFHQVQGVQGEGTSAYEVGSPNDSFDRYFTHIIARIQGTPVPGDAEPEPDGEQE